MTIRKDYNTFSKCNTPTFNKNKDGFQQHFNNIMFSQYNKNLQDQKKIKGKLNHNMIIILVFLQAFSV